MKHPSDFVTRGDINEQYPTLESKYLQTMILATHIANPNGNWGTMRFKIAFLASPAIHLFFVAHTNAENISGVGQPFTNHWTFFLTSAGEDGGTCVHVDASLSEVGRPGMIILDDDTRLDERSNDYSYTIEVLAARGCIAVNVPGGIVNKRRDNHIVTSVGESCQF